MVLIMSCLVMTGLIAGCGNDQEDPGEMGIIDSIRNSGVKTVGTDILPADITDFYYTEENINFNAYYLRYRFYIEDGKKYFFYDERKRDGEYGPATEADRIMSGSFEISDDVWDEFFESIKGGTVKKRTESADSGDSGPWTYLYWNGDKGKIQEYSFASQDSRNTFIEICRRLSEDNEASLDGKYRLILDDAFFTAERTVYAPGDEVTVYYDMIATDTDYHFFSHDVDIHTGYDNDHGYVITFVMPERDVTLSVSCKNSMEYDPGSEEGSMTLYIDGEAVPVTWEDNEATDALKGLCPLDITAGPYGGFEIVGDIGSDIPAQDSRITTRPGDIMLYAGSNIVLFYGSNTWEYTRLGHIDMAEERITELLENSSGKISLELN